MENGAKKEINKIKEKQATLGEKMAQISTDVDWLKHEMTELKQRQERLENKVDKLHYMLISTLLGTLINIVITLALRGI